MRRPLLLGLATLALLVTTTPATARTAPPLRDGDYFAFADRVLLGLGAQWDAAQGVYVSRHKGAAARTNANLLLIHATAALHAHSGPSRQDERARVLVARLTHPPMLGYRRGRGRARAQAQGTGRLACGAAPCDLGRPLPSLAGETGRGG